MYMPQVQRESVWADDYGCVLAYWRGVAWSCVAVFNRRCGLCPVMIEPVPGVCYVGRVGVKFVCHCYNSIL